MCIHKVLTKLGETSAACNQLMIFLGSLCSHKYGGLPKAESVVASGVAR